ncbi:MAG TPA: hypothetical protein VGA10_04535 [Thermoanaerobaculia bacterium]
MLELYDLGCAIVENGAATLTLIVPWYGYATMDRATKVIHALAREIADPRPLCSLGERERDRVRDKKYDEESQ